VVDGGLNIEDLGDELGVELPNSDFDSVGGFIFSTLERVPEEGDSVEFAAHRFVVESVEGRRVRLVRIEVPPSVADDAESVTSES